MPDYEIPGYQIIGDSGGTFRVQVTFPSGHVQVIASFATEASAKDWIADQLIRAVKPAREA
jgi:hypothetical protein